MQLRNPPASMLRAQNGNVLFIILIAIALMGALTFTLSKTENASSTMGTQQASLAANQIISYASQVENAVDQMMASGTTDTNISFEGGPAGSYANPAAAARNKVFDPAGGGMKYAKPDTAWLMTDTTTTSLKGDWFFTGALCVKYVGTGPASCLTGTTANMELLMILPFLNKDVCAAINAKLGIPLNASGGIYPTNDYIISGTPSFTGTYSAKYEIKEKAGSTILDTKTSACVKAGNNNSVDVANAYYYYKVLIAR